MSDTPPNRVSMRKSSGQPADSARSGSKPKPPQQVRYAAGALLLVGIASVAAGLGTFGVKGWLLAEAEKSNQKSKGPLSHAELVSQVNKTPVSQLIVCIVILIAVVLTARAAYRGHHFTRWVVLGLWVLCSVTPTPAGLGSLISVVASVPLAYKVPAFVAGAAMLGAVVMVNLRPSTEFFNANRPPRPAGAPARRGLFGPRYAPPPTRTEPATTATPPAPAVSRSGAAAATPPPADRSKAKQRASADAVAKGADLARTRAKAASKSRRTGA